MEHGLITGERRGRGGQWARARWRGVYLSEPPPFASRPPFVSRSLERGERTECGGPRVTGPPPFLSALALPCLRLVVVLYSRERGRFVAHSLSFAVTPPVTRSAGRSPAFEFRAVCRNHVCIRFCFGYMLFRALLEKQSFVRSYFHVFRRVGTFDRFFSFIFSISQIWLQGFLIWE